MHACNSNGGAHAYPGKRKISVGLFVQTRRAPAGRPTKNAPSDGKKCTHVNYAHVNHRDNEDAPGQEPGISDLPTLRLGLDGREVRRWLPGRDAGALRLV